MSKLAAKATAIFFGSAIAGAGFGLGHDVYKTFKKNVIAFLILALLFSPFVFSYLAGILFWRRGLFAFVAAAASLVLGVCAAFFTQGFFANIAIELVGVPSLSESIVLGDWVVPLHDFLARALGIDPSPYSDKKAGGGLSAQSINAFMLSWSMPCILGLLIGGAREDERRKANVLSDKNEQFLVDNGIAETGEEDVTHIDAFGNNLRLLETSKKRFVFMVVGRRGARAYISLNEIGEFVTYTAPGTENIPRECLNDGTALSSKADTRVTAGEHIQGQDLDGVVAGVSHGSERAARAPEKGAELARPAVDGMHDLGVHRESRRWSVEKVLRAVLSTLVLVIGTLILCVFAALVIATVWGGDWGLAGTLLVIGTILFVGLKKVLSLVKDGAGKNE